MIYLMKRVIFQFATLNNQRVIRQITIQAPMVLAMEPGQSSCGDVFLSYKPPICKIFSSHVWWHRMVVNSWKDQTCGFDFQCTDVTGFKLKKKECHDVEFTAPPNLLKGPVQVVMRGSWPILVLMELSWISHMCAWNVDCAWPSDTWRIHGFLVGPFSAGVEPSTFWCKVQS